ncbi:hypothetical protein [Acinetobacter baumannii]|uniref:hypothetical protein n=1 Tax=Acinetobacter baumannii TaxID=470 RepID=UPI00102082C1|nr:hypothetical protein [Acinetobacter baumannii]MDK2169771.1 hypothetical protein [Acinetobacter baumannii]MDK2180592.1 hypothetical protein [Acinetobacter baumannii]MDK2326342.1 hypothetical protein [Acinetobacter baumannii]RYL18601.1 hypothetical protein EWO92_04765 [Acinetobacter baumannii]RYL31485.1 hypothetical protein EWO96_04765 [Acinetobacter baumannii]
MIKDILLNYIMGKYRRIIVIICACIGLLTIGRLIILDNFIFGEKFFALVLSYLAFIAAIYNGSPVGFLAVNTDSNDFDIGMRVIFIILTLSIFIYISYSIF